MLNRITRVPHCLSLTQYHVAFHVTGLSPAMADLSSRSVKTSCYHNRLFVSLATTIGISVDSFPRATEMFQFTRFAS